VSDKPTLALAAGATVVAVAFAASLFERWVVRRRPHELAWAIALTWFACGALSLWAGAALGWHGWSFRLFYLFGAVVNVPFLALGTVELLYPRVAPRVRTGVVLACTFAAGVVLVAPFTGPVSGTSIPQGSAVFGPLPRILAAVFSSGGATVVFGCAVASALRLWRGNGPRRLAGGNAVIALGTAILSMSGLLNSALGQMRAFSVTLTVGVCVLFLGFVLASSPLRRRRTLKSVEAA
jgi:MFS family permease